MTAAAAQRFSDGPVWRRALVIALLVGLAKADGAAVGVVAPALESDLHVSTAQIGLLAFPGRCYRGTFRSTGGSLVDRRRRVVIITVSLVAWSLALGLAGLATGFVILCLARLLSGGVASVARPAAISIAGDSFEAAERGRAVAVLAVAGVLGSAACYLLGAISVGLLNWRWLFALLAGAGVALALAAARLDDPLVERREAPAIGQVMVSLLRIRTNLVVQIADSIGTFFLRGGRLFRGAVRDQAIRVAGLARRRPRPRPGDRDSGREPRGGASR